VIAQVAPADKLVPQVLVWLKSEEFVPPIEIPEIASAADPVFVSVTL
jgi:hypothetical protein